MRQMLTVLMFIGVTALLLNGCAGGSPPKAAAKPIPTISYPPTFTPDLSTPTAAPTSTPVIGNQVTIQHFAFIPANLQVKVGTTVTWTNQDTPPHLVTFRDSSLTSSETLQKGDVYTYTFTKAGAFAYYCQIHPDMVAQVVVTP